MTFDISAMKVKIANLLAKAERTTNEHERDAFTTKAEHLMLQLGINQAELEAAGEVKSEPIVEEHRVWTGNYSIVMVPFVHNIARGFGNLTILQSSNYNGMVRTTFIIGHKSDVETFLTLVDSLALQVMAALKRWQKENRDRRRYYTDMEKYTENRSFIAGFGSEVRTRLYNARKEEEQEATPGAALVLASKQDKVDAWTQEKFNPRAPRRGMKSHDFFAAQSGAAAGKKASLGEKGIGGNRGQIG